MSRQPTLLRSLTLRDATMLVIGCIVGVGIFRSASSIANHLQSPGLIVLLWVLGGLLSLCGALCYAELAALFPSTGGDYVYISRIYGRFWGFLFGWTKLFVERTGTIAILVFFFAEYLSRVMPYPPGAGRALAVGATLLLTWVNVAGVRWGALVQNLFTLVKMAALAIVVLAGIHLFLGNASASPDWSLPPVKFSTVQSMGVALVFVLFAYGGWTEAAYIAEEVQDPTRTVPQAMLQGLVLTGFLYVAVSAAYMLAVPIAALPSTPLVAARVVEGAIGPWGGLLMAGLIACSAFGAANGYILTGGRILYALGQDHALFARLGRLHPKHRTPALALWVNAAVVIVLVCTKTFDQIATYSTVAITVFYVMAVAGVIILRRRQPKLQRPYRAWGYPWTALLFCLTMVGFIANLWIEAPKDTAFGFGWMALGIPLYWWSQRSVA